MDDPRSKKQIAKDAIEDIVLRRLYNAKIAGYTLEMSGEILEAVYPIIAKAAKAEILEVLEPFARAEYRWTELPDTAEIVPGILVGDIRRAAAIRSMEV